MALEKPFIHSTLAEGDPDPVNYNDVFTFRKTKEISTGKTKSKFFIEFNRDENSSSPKTIIWKYINECDRNNEFDKILSLTSVSI